MGGEIVHRELEHLAHAIEFQLLPRQGRSKQRRLVIVAEQVLVTLAICPRSEGGGKQTLGKNDPGTQSRTESLVGAFADPREAVAGRYHPTVRRRALEVSPEIFEDGGIVGRHRREVVECFVGAGDNAGGGNVVAEDAAIHHLGKEGGLRNQLVQQVGNVFLPVRHERLVVASAAAEGDYHRFSAGHHRHPSEACRTEDRFGGARSGYRSKEVATVE